MKQILFSDYVNKVNIITVSRVLLTIIGVLFIFSGNIKLIVVAYAIMGFSEVTDVLDGYVARRDKMVTDLGKILDPLSDSVSRFFYFFALSYHGLFPIWFMIFFFFRDIVVAYIRIFASFSGTVMSARISGKVKGLAQFAGQYLLMFALMINIINKGNQISNKFIYTTLGITLVIYFGTLIYFRIKGFLLYVIVGLSILLSLFLVFLNNLHFTVNYFTTFIIAFVTIAVTLFSLVDYLLSLNNKYGAFGRTIITIGLVGVMFLISPYFLDMISNKFESNAISPNWEKISLLDKLNEEDYLVQSVTKADNYLILAVKHKTDNKLRLFVYNFSSNEPVFVDAIKISDKIKSISDMDWDGELLYILDSEKNKIYITDFLNSFKSEGLNIVKEFSTGFYSSKSIALVNFNNTKYIITNGYIFSNMLYFFDLNKISSDKELKNQASYQIKSEFYLKSACYDNNKYLYVLVNKLGNDLIYKVDFEKAIFNGNIQSGIEIVVSTKDRNLKGLTFSENKLFSYGDHEKIFYKCNIGALK